MPEAELAALLEATKSLPLLPPVDAPEWRAAQENPELMRWMGPVLELAEREAQAPTMPPLTDELYAHFGQTGDRLTFERVYFERRRQLGRAAIRVLFAGPERRAETLPVLVRRMEEMLAEESWALPAHCWSSDNGKDPMTLDLFAAETANVLAELVTVFGPLLPPELVERLYTRLEVQVFENYLHGEFPHWKGSTHNWNAVCHQGTLGAALAMERDMGRLARSLTLAGELLPHFLRGFGADGSTSEGPGYWSYGYGRFVELNAQLEVRTGGALTIFGENPLIRRIAEFGPALVLRGGQFVNFADGGRRGRLSCSLLAYLGERFAMPALSAEAALGYRQAVDDGPALDGQRFDFFHLDRFILRFPQNLEAAPAPVVPKDQFFPDYGAVVARGEDAQGNYWEFAAKGGHNEEHHNHNDCGSYILNINGEALITEIGAPEYVRAFFKAETRYDFLAARSLGHSVPLVNGVEQHVGRQFAARVLNCEIRPERVHFAVELAGAYPPEALCRSLVRTFTWDRVAGVITVEDAFELEKKGDVRTCVIFEAPGEVEINGTACQIRGESATLSIAPLPGTQILTLEPDQYMNHSGREVAINRLRLGHAEPGRSGKLGYSIRLA